MSVTADSSAKIEANVLRSLPVTHPLRGSGVALMHLPSLGTASASIAPTASTARADDASSQQHRHPPVAVGHLSAGPISASFPRSPVGRVTEYVPHLSPAHRAAHEVVSSSPARSLLHRGGADDMEASARASGERVLVDAHKLLALLNRQRCHSTGCAGTLITTTIRAGGLVWEVACACDTCKAPTVFLNIDDSTFVAQYSPAKEEALGKRRAAAATSRSRRAAAKGGIPTAVSAAPSTTAPGATASVAAPATTGGGGDTPSTAAAGEHCGEAERGESKLPLSELAHRDDRPPATSAASGALGTATSSPRVAPAADPPSRYAQQPRLRARRVDGRLTRRMNLVCAAAFCLHGVGITAALAIMAHLGLVCPGRSMMEELYDIVLREGAGLATECLAAHAQKACEHPGPVHIAADGSWAKRREAAHGSLVVLWQRLPMMMQVMRREKISTINAAPGECTVTCVGNMPADSSSNRMETDAWRLLGQQLLETNSPLQEKVASICLDRDNSVPKLISVAPSAHSIIPLSTSTLLSIFHLSRVQF